MYTRTRARVRACVRTRARDPRVGGGLGTVPPTGAPNCADRVTVATACVRAGS